MKHSATKVNWIFLVIRSLLMLVVHSPGMVQCPRSPYALHDMRRHELPLCPYRRIHVRSSICPRRWLPVGEQSGKDASTGPSEGIRRQKSRVEEGATACMVCTRKGGRTHGETAPRPGYDLNYWCGWSREGEGQRRSGWVLVGAM